MFSYVGLNKSLNNATALPVSSKISCGRFCVFCTLMSASSQRFMRILSSASSSATLLPSATVRTMTPQFLGLMLLMSCLSLARSSPLFILVDTDTLSPKGIRTRYLPAKLNSPVSRGPFVDIGSLTICTNTSSPTVSVFCTLPSFLRSGSLVAFENG